MRRRSWVEEDTLEKQTEKSQRHGGSITEASGVKGANGKNGRTRPVPSNAAKGML